MKFVVAALVLSVLVGVGIAYGSKDYFRRKAAEAAVAEAAAAAASTRPPPQPPTRATTVAPTEEPVPEPPVAPPVTPPTQPMSPEVMEALGNRRVSLQRCYEAAAAQDESIGTMGIEVTFDLDQSGLATNIVATGGTRSVNQCVVGVVRRTTFPKQDERLHTNYAFELPLE